MISPAQRDHGRRCLARQLRPRAQTTYTRNHGHSLDPFAGLGFAVTRGFEVWVSDWAEAVIASGRGRVTRHPSLGIRHRRKPRPVQTDTSAGPAPAPSGTTQSTRLVAHPLHQERFTRQGIGFYRYDGRRTSKSSAAWSQADLLGPKHGRRVRDSMRFLMKGWVRRGKAGRMRQGHRPNRGDNQQTATISMGT